MCSLAAGFTGKPIHRLWPPTAIQVPRDLNRPFRTDYFGALGEWSALLHSSIEVIRSLLTVSVPIAFTFVIISKKLWIQFSLKVVLALYPDDQVPFLDITATSMGPPDGFFTLISFA